MTNILNWFKSDKRRIGAVVIWSFIVFYAIFCVFFSVKKAYADTVKLPEYPSEFQYYIVIQGNGSTDLICFDTYYDGADKLVFDVDNGKISNIGKSEGYRLVDNSWQLYSSNNPYMFPYGVERILFSNVDIYDINDTLFFLKTPLATSHLTMWESQTGGTILQKVMTPLGGVVAFLIVFLIGFLAFRKGWRFLAKNLQGA